MRTILAGLTAVLFVFLLLPTASNAEQLPFLLHGNLGFGKMLEDGAPDGGIGLGAGIIYPLQDSQIAIGGDLGWQMLGSEEGSYGYGVTADLSLSTIPITGQVYYFFPPGETVGFYADAGLGFYSLRSSIDISGVAGGSSSDSETEFGINGGAGARFGDPDAKITFGVDLKYHVVMTEGESTDIITVYGRIFFH